MTRVQPGDVIAGAWLLQDSIGRGANGKVYDGQHTRNGTRVAIKVERHRGHEPEQVCNEHEMYKRITKASSSRPPRGIPMAFCFAWTGSEHFMVMERLGPSLGRIFSQQGRPFELHITLRIGIELLHALETIHRMGIVHKDIKPSNILTGRRGKQDELYLVDYGISSRFQDDDGNTLPPAPREPRSVGSLTFAPLRAHLELAQSPRDDLEALGYVLLYFHGAQLPWERHGVWRDRVAVLQSKFDATVATICRGQPRVFHRFFTYTRGLRCGEMPDHALLRRRLHGSLRRLNGTPDR